MLEARLIAATIHSRTVMQLSWRSGQGGRMPSPPTPLPRTGEGSQQGTGGPGRHVAEIPPLRSQARCGRDDSEGWQGRSCRDDSWGCRVATVGMTSGELRVCYPHWCDEGAIGVFRAEPRRRVRTGWWRGSSPATNEREGGASRMATTREQLRKMLDDIPDDRLDEAGAALALLSVPDDDEPTTAEDLEAIARSRENFHLGKTVPDEVVRRELGL
jgi:hypothetical protein